MKKWAVGDPVNVRKVVDMSRIPDGWEYWTSELSADEAWRRAVEYKQTRERTQNSVFVRVKVIPARGCFWILHQIEPRTISHPKAA